VSPLRVRGSVGAAQLRGILRAGSRCSRASSAPRRELSSFVSGGAFVSGFCGAAMVVSGAASSSSLAASLRSGCRRVGRFAPSVLWSSLALLRLRALGRSQPCSLLSTGAYSALAQKRTKRKAARFAVRRSVFGLRDFDCFSTRTTRLLEAMPRPAPLAASVLPDVTGSASARLRVWARSGLGILVSALGSGSLLALGRRVRGSVRPRVRAELGRGARVGLAVERAGCWVGCALWTRRSGRCFGAGVVLLPMRCQRDLLWCLLAALFGPP
jgi:hypothetical protein